MQVDRPIAITIILFIILLAAFFLVVPEYKTFGTLRTELGEKKAEYNAQFEYYATVSKLYHNLLGRRDDIAKIDDAIPENQDLGKTVYFFQKAAKENGLMVKSLVLSKSSPINPTKTPAKNTMKETVFSIDLIGDYVSLGKFMAALEKSARIFDITSISFGSSDMSSVLSLQSATATQSQFQVQQIYNFSLQIKTQSY